MLLIINIKWLGCVFVVYGCGVARTTIVKFVSYHGWIKVIKVIVSCNRIVIVTCWFLFFFIVYIFVWFYLINYKYINLQLFSIHLKAVLVMTMRERKITRLTVRVYILGTIYFHDLDILAENGNNIHAISKHWFTPNRTRIESFMHSWSSE